MEGNNGGYGNWKKLREEVFGTPQGGTLLCNAKGEHCCVRGKKI